MALSKGLPGLLMLMVMSNRQWNFRRAMIHFIHV
jgi:hypothetical protein